MASPPCSSRLIYLLLLVNAVFARSAIDQQQESTNDREDLEEIVFGKIFVGVVLMKLGKHWLSKLKFMIRASLPSRSC